MTAYRVAVIGGDGIGPEVIAEALKVCRAAGAGLDTVSYDLGSRRYLETGEVLVDSVLDELRGFDAILFGAVGTPDVPPGVLERGLLLRLRFELDLFVNLRPFVASRSVGAGVPVHKAVVTSGYSRATWSTVRCQRSPEKVSTLVLWTRVRW